jgi:hypothetical protein
MHGSEKVLIIDDDDDDRFSDEDYDNDNIVYDLI